MACSACGRPRSVSAPPINRNSGTNRSAAPAGRVVDSQSITTQKRVQTAVASNPNSPNRTKV